MLGLRATRGLVAVLVLPLLAPTLAASVPSTCVVHSDPAAIELANGLFLKATPRLPVATSRIDVWADENGAAGLQTSWSPCGFDEPALPPDRLVVSVSGVLTL